MKTIFFAAAAAITVTACGGSGGGEANAPTLVGSWTCNMVEESQTSKTETNMALSYDASGKMTNERVLTISSPDSTMVVTLQTEGTWERKDEFVKEINTKVTVPEASINDTNLPAEALQQLQAQYAARLTNGDVVLRIEKLTEAELTLNTNSSLITCKSA